MKKGPPLVLCIAAGILFVMQIIILFIYLEIQKAIESQERTLKQINSSIEELKQFQKQNPVSASFEKWHDAQHLEKYYHFYTVLNPDAPWYVRVKSLKRLNQLDRQTCLKTCEIILSLPSKNKDPDFDKLVELAKQLHPGKSTINKQ